MRKNYRWPLLLTGLVIAVALPASLLFFLPKPMISNSAYGQARIIFPTQTVTARIPLTAEAQQLGLGGVTMLADTEGMMWNFSSPLKPTFWMKGMKIALDFIWIRDGKVVDLDQNIQPPSSLVNLPIYSPDQDVTQVLEVPAGFIMRHSVTVGQTVTIEE